MTRREYISLSCDNLAVFPPSEGKEESRTALQLYEDYMAAFKAACQAHIDNGTLVEIQVGCGPCGELRQDIHPCKTCGVCARGQRKEGEGRDEGEQGDVESAVCVGV